MRVDGMSNRSDVDWFSFNTSATGSINITLDHNRRDDFDWALYGTSGGALLRKKPHLSLKLAFIAMHLLGNILSK